MKYFLVRNKNRYKEAVVEGNSYISYKELYERSFEIAEMLKRHLNNRSHIAIVLPNSISYVVAYCSILLAEHVIVPIYYKASQSEIKNTIECCDVGLIITDSAGQKKISESCFRHRVIVFNIDNYEMLEFGDRDVEAIITSPIDVAVMLGTSGSVNAPKRVMLSNENIISNVLAISESLHYDSSEKFLAVLPFTFAAGNTSQIATSLILGATLYIYSGPLYPEFLFKSVEKYGITSTTIVSSVLNVLLEDNRSYEKETKTLKVICFGGNKTGSRIFDMLLNNPLCNKFVHIYGQTEASPRISHLHLLDEKNKVPSVGRPLSGIEVKINKIHVENNEGEILVRGKNVMLGYYKQNDSPIKDGWLATGDIGYIDDDGYIYITGRKKNIIIYSGMNIYAEEVEEVLLQNESVSEAVVYGEKNEQYGEVPMAKVVLRESATVTEADLRRYCAEKLSYYKVPVHIFIEDAFEKTYNGKIKR